MSKKKNKRKINKIYESSDLANLDMKLYQPACVLISVYRELLDFMDTAKKEIDWDDFHVNSYFAEDKISLLLMFDPYLYVFHLFCECMDIDNNRSSTNTTKAKDRFTLGYVLSNLPNYFESVKDDEKFVQKDKLVEYSQIYLSTQNGKKQKSKVELWIRENYNTNPALKSKSSSSKHIERFIHRGYPSLDLRFKFPEIWKSVCEITDSSESTQDENSEELLDHKYTPEDLDLDEDIPESVKRFPPGLKERVIEWCHVMNTVSKSRFTLDEILNKDNAECRSIRVSCGNHYQVIRFVKSLCDVVKETDPYTSVPLAIAAQAHLLKFCNSEEGYHALPKQEDSTLKRSSNTPSTEKYVEIIKATVAAYGEIQEKIDIENSEDDDSDSESKSKRQKLNSDTDPVSHAESDRVTDSGSVQKVDLDSDSDPAPSKSKSKSDKPKSTTDSKGLDSTAELAKSKDRNKDTINDPPVKPDKGGSVRTNSDSSSSGSVTPVPTPVDLVTTPGQDSSVDSDSNLGSSKNPPKNSDKSDSDSVEVSTANSSSSIKTNDEFILLIMQLNTEEEKNAFMLNHCKTLVLPAYKDALDLIMSRSFP